MVWKLRTLCTKIVSKNCAQRPAQIVAETNQAAVENHPRDNSLTEDEGASMLSEA